MCGFAEELEWLDGADEKALKPFGGKGRNYRASVEGSPGYLRFLSTIPAQMGSLLGYRCAHAL
jgi:hypothetical protein